MPKLPPSPKSPRLPDPKAPLSPHKAPSAQQLLTSEDLPSADHPEVVWRLAILRPRFAALGPNDPILPSLTQVRAFEPRPLPSTFHGDPPSVKRISVKRVKDGKSHTVKEPDDQYFKRVERVYQEWKDARDAEEARRAREEVWQCIDCGEDVRYAHFRCFYCLAAYKIASLEHFNPVPDDEGVSLPDFDPEEALGH